ncbi:unnamed protein product [Calypogeia fissa]
MSLASACYTAMDYDATDSVVALKLKVIGFGAIFIAGVIGVSLPFIGRGFSFLSTEGNVFFISRAFAAGVILATGFVHILPEGVEALRNPCLPEFWLSFPLGESVAMFVALTTLLVDNMCIEYYEDLHSHRRQKHDGQSERQPLLGSRSVASMDGRPDRRFLREKSLLRLGSHAAAEVVIVSVSKLAPENSIGNTQHVQEIGVVGDHHHHLLTEEEEAHIRNVVILQVLEVAVISHSFIIGLSLGISENPSLITPLLAALSFHQFFEGFALGGSICQAAFECTSSTLRAGLFAVTTPLGIMVGIGIASTYRANTAKALIVEGLFECASAGILIYMALVALIARDFQSERLRGNRLLQLFSYIALFGGTLAMASLAYWA